MKDKILDVSEFKNATKPFKDIKTEELLNCPFCGSSQISIGNTWTISYWVECENCYGRAEDLEGEGRDGKLQEHKDSIARAVMAWNRRA